MGSEGSIPNTPLFQYSNIHFVLGPRLLNLLTACNRAVNEPQGESNVIVSVIEMLHVSVFCHSLASVSAQDRDAIIAKAKEEKVFVYYSTTDIRDGTAMVHAFQKKYPFIEPKLLRLGSTQVVVKVLQEHRGGVHLFDVISATSFQFYEIFKEGLFQKYESPERRAFAEDFKDKDGYCLARDCNESNASINSAAIDIPGDGIDQNCDGRDTPK